MDEECTEITELRKSEILEALTKWFLTETPFEGPPDIKCPRFIKMNLEAENYDVEKAKEEITNYIRMKTLHPKIMRPFNFQDKNALALFDLCTVTCDIGRGNCDFPLVLTINYCKIDDIYEAVRMNAHISLVLWLESVKYHRKKFISVIDVSDSNYNLLLQMTPSFLEEAKECIENMNRNIVQIHIVNTGIVLGALLQASRLTMPTSFNEITYIHSGSWDCLSDFIPPESLPEEYGGTNVTLAEHKETIRGLMLEWNDYMMELDKYEFKTPSS